MPYNCITQPQIRIINYLIGQNPELKDHKADIIKQFTGGRSSSTKEMAMDEARQLIGHLKSLDPKDTKSDVMRKKIISLAHEMGWRDEMGKIKMEHVNGWCKKFGYLKKPLDKYSYEELPQLVSQFEKVYKDFLTKM